MDIAQKDRYLHFLLGNDEFAVPLQSVREVAALPEISRAPLTPAYFSGIVNLRGLVLSAIDLRMKLGVKPINRNEDTMIVCAVGDAMLAVIVDAVIGVLEISKLQIVAAPDVQMKLQAKCTVGVYFHMEKLISVVDIGKALDLDDLKVVERLSGPSVR